MTNTHFSTRTLSHTYTRTNTNRLAYVYKHPRRNYGILTQFVHSARSRYAQYVLIAKTYLISRIRRPTSSEINVEAANDRFVSLRTSVPFYCVTVSRPHFTIAVYNKIPDAAVVTSRAAQE